MKISPKVIVPSLFVPLLTLVLVSLKNNIFSVATLNGSNQNYSSPDETSSTSHIQQLSVLGNRCRGCGKCARFDSEHFEMNDRQAKVISSSNLNSSNLQIAINNCPAQAISLN